MSRNESDWTELRNVLVILLLSMIFVSIIDFSGADISRLSVLTAIFVLVLALMARRSHLV